MISRLVVVNVAAFITVIVYVKVVSPPTVSSFQLVNGLVKSTRFSSARTMYGGHIELAEIALPDGQIFTAHVESGSAIAVGTTVPLHIYEDGTVELAHPL
jgi:hypothetical protein